MKIKVISASNTCYKQYVLVFNFYSKCVDDYWWFSMSFNVAKWQKLLQNYVKYRHKNFWRTLPRLKKSMHSEQIWSQSDPYMCCMFSLSYILVLLVLVCNLWVLVMCRVKEKGPFPLIHRKSHRSDWHSNTAIQHFPVYLFYAAGLRPPVSCQSVLLPFLQKALCELCLLALFDLELRAIFNNHISRKANYPSLCRDHLQMIQVSVLFIDILGRDSF